MPYEPEPRDIHNIKRTLENDHKKWKDRIVSARRQRYGEGTLGIPASIETTGTAIKSRFTWDFLYRLIGTMTGLPVETHITEEEREGSEANKNKRELFDTALINRFNGPPRMTLDMVPDAQVGDGIAVLKAGVLPLRNYERLEGEDTSTYENRIEYLNRSENRLFLTDVDPTTWNPIYEGRELQGYLQVDKRPKARVLNDLGLTTDEEFLAKRYPAMPGINANTRLPGGYVDVMEYCDDHYIQVYVQNRLVSSAPNPYGRVNCFPAYGITTSSRDLDKISFPATEGMEDLEREFDAVLTSIRNAAMLKIGSGGIEGLPDSETIPLGKDNLPVPIQFSYGTFTQTKGRFTDPFPGASAIFQLIQLVPILLELMQRQGLAPLFAGISPGANAPGYAITSLYSIAKSAHNRLVGNYAYCLTEVVKFFEYCIAYVIKETVSVDHHSLSPNDIKNWPAKIEVTRPPILPVDRRADGAFLLDAYSKGAVSMRRVREDGFHLEQPDLEDDQLVLEAAQKALDAMVIQAYIQNLMMGIGQAGPQIVGPSGEPISSGTTGVRTGGNAGRTSIPQEQNLNRAFSAETFAGATA